MARESEIHASEEIQYSVSEQIATITINRPEAHNTISRPMLGALSKHLLEANTDEDVRVIILTGEGRFFCTGLDMRGGDIAQGLLKKNSPPTLDLRNAPPIVLHDLNKPVICALNGSCAGYGMDLALGCDIRIMAADAKMAAAFTARGIVPESGGTWILPRLLGWSKAAEIIFTSQILTAEESLEIGLCSRVVATELLSGEARSMARKIAANAPMAVQASKRLMRIGMEETFSDHVHHVYLQLLPLFKSEDFKEGMTAFMEKRQAVFKGC